MTHPTNDLTAPKQEGLMPFTITDADIGRYVRQKSTGEVARARKDPGNGWLHPEMLYEWKWCASDFEYVEIVTPTKSEAATGEDGEVAGAAAYFTESKISEIARNCTNALCGTFTPKYLRILVKAATRPTPQRSQLSAGDLERVSKLIEQAKKACSFINVKRMKNKCGYDQWAYEIYASDWDDVDNPLDEALALLPATEKE